MSDAHVFDPQSWDPLPATSVLNPLLLTCQYASSSHGMKVLLWKRLLKFRFGGTEQDIEVDSSRVQSLQGK